MYRRSSRAHAGIGLVVCALATIAGCSSHPAGWTTDASRAVRPPTPAPLSQVAPGSPSGAALPSAPSSAPAGTFTIAAPLDITKFSETPCGAIRDEAVAAMSVGAGQQTNPGGHLTCRWQAKDSSGQITLTFGSLPVRALYDNAAAQPPGSGTKPLQLKGYPGAEAATRPNGWYSCNVDVAVADGAGQQQGFHLTILQTAANTCPLAEDVAGEILDSLGAH